MAPQKETLVQPRREAPIRSLRVEVLEGPDAQKAHLATSDVLTIGTATGNDLVLTDQAVSRYHVELRREPDGGVSVIDLSSTNGTFVGTTRLGRGRIAAGTELRLGDTALRVEDGDEVGIELSSSSSFHGLEGRSAPMRRLFSQIDRAAQSQASCLLTGQTGTGKELAARAIHDASPRSSKPFEVVDCGVLLPALVASELFGHEKGAFTGADSQHVGAFERADGGTIFLDEIGELPPQLQAVLLGVLERRKFRRVGGSSAIEVDVRVIAATHRDLRHEVNEGGFRSDLYYRLAVIRLEMPPLADRREDIEPLASRFLEQAGHEGPLSEVIPPSVLDSLEKYHWPGNVRELRNLVESALAMGDVPELPASHSGAEHSAGFLRVPEGALFGSAFKHARAQVLRDFEREYVKQLLDRHDGNVSKSARVAKLNRAYLQELIKRHGLR